MTYEMKFDEKHVDSLLNGNKCITVRPPDEVQFLEGGESVTLLTPDGDMFGRAVVDRMKDMRAHKFTRLRLDGHHTYRGVGDLLRELNGYYPGRHFTGAHMLSVIWFRDIEPADN